MKRKPEKPLAAAELRRRAEARLSEKRGSRRSEDDTQRLVQELQIHQIELEMQNEELDQARVEVEALLDQYTELYDFAPVGYFTLGRDGTIHRVNLTGALLLGIERSRLMNRRFALFVSDDTRPTFNAFLAKVFEGLSKETCDVALLKQGNHPLFAHIDATMSEGGQECRAVVVDITERKRAGAEREKLQGQLLHAQKLDTIGRLSGGIAHDFNNLLTPIIGNAEMALSDMSREDPLHEVMEEIRNAGARAASLTRQLLAFSRKQILQPEILDLNGVVRDMDKMLRRIIREDVEVESILSPELGRVEADVAQMEQVLMNLVVNARDAMPRGGTLTIETSNVDLDEDYARNHVSVTPGPYVMLAVSDTGVGMTKEIQDQLFEPFFTTKEKGKVTGLGLSTVYGIVKQSKGNIWVYSEPGKGSAFKVYLPRAKEETAHVTVKPGKKEESLQGSEAILVVEDDEMVRNITIKALKKYGYTVLCASDGKEALHMCREHKEQVQLMLSDVVMPGMSGRDLAEGLQRIRPGMKVLFMSGYTDDAIVHHGVLDKGVAFLQKPFTPEGLARKVREALGD